MLKVITLAVGFAGMQLLPMVSVDVSGGNPPAASDQGQAGDSVSAPALRIVRVIEVTDGSGVTQISNTLDQVEDYPVWSPGGKKIAYSTVNTGKIYVAVLEEVK